MSFIIPPVTEAPSKEPSGETKLEIADLKPGKRMVFLYERSVEDLTLMRDHFKDRVMHLEQLASKDRPFEVQLSELKVRHSETTTQHVVTVILVGLGTLGMTIFSKTESPVFYWATVTLASAGLLFGACVKPLAAIIRWWHSFTNKR